MPGLTHSFSVRSNYRIFSKLHAITMIAVLFILASFSFAAPIPQDIAAKTAQDWSYLHGWHLKQAGWAGADGAEPAVQFKGNLYDDQGSIVAYKYSLPTGGEIVVANEDSMSPIFMYSDTHEFDPNANATAKYLFDVFVANVKCSRDANKVPHTGWTAISNKAGQFRMLGAQASAIAQSMIGPLLATTWDQGYPYNLYCPIYRVPYVGSFSTPTGCTATAMAQIMNYWKFPPSGQGNSGQYQCSWWYLAPDPNDPNDPNKIHDQEFKVTVPSVRFSSYSYDWANMPEPDAWSAYSWSSEAALLMFHCGAAVHMDYTPGWSGAPVLIADDPNYCAEKAFKTFFKYQSANGFFRDDFTREEWETKMQDQVLMNQPVLYAGWDISLGGHAFVLDGMQEGPQGSLFHFNLGWSGRCDGWYTVDVLLGNCSVSDGFPLTQRAVADIYTPDGPKKLTTLVSPEGSAAIVRSSNSSRFVYGATVDVTVNPYPGYRFDHWEGDLGGADNPATVVMDGNKTITAVMIVAYRLNRQKDGEGKVIVSPDKEYYEPGEQVTVTAEPADGWAFDHWEGDATGTVNPATVTLNRESRVKAIFRQAYKLTIVRSGQGDVTRQPAQNSFSYGDFVTLNATPAQGWVFRQWSGDINTQENPTMIRIDGDKTIKAEFVKMSESYRTLSVTNVGEGQVNPMNGAFPQDTKVILTAVPASGWKFYQWQGDVDTISEVSPLEITMNKDRGITAVFIQEQSQTPAHSTVQGNQPTVNQGGTTGLESQQSAPEEVQDSEFHFPNLINSCTLLSTVLLLALAGSFFLLRENK